MINNNNVLFLVDSGFQIDSEDKSMIRKAEQVPDTKCNLFDKQCQTFSFFAELSF